MTIRRSAASLSALLLAGVFVVAACGSSASSGAPGASSGGGGGGGEKTPPGGLPGVGGGSCEVKLAGDVTASWKDEQDLSSIIVSYWLSASEREMLEMKPDDASFLFNCQGGETGTLSVMSAGDATTALFPKGPGTYVIPKSGILGGGEAGQVSILLTIGKDALWRVVEDGTLNVTKLDGKTFAGNLQVKVERLDDEMNPDASANLTATFEFGCTSGACG